ncbi:TolC family protein, partial [Paucibacter sp. XJ19-41]
MMRLALSLLCLAALSACSSAPELKRYEPALAAEFANKPAEASTGEPVAQFWRGFNDAQLDRLIAQSLQANTDLRIAAANLQEARALGRFADAQQLPTVGLAAGAARVRAQNDQGQAQTRRAYSAGFDVAWEADLFGRLSGEQRA